MYLDSWTSWLRTGKKSGHWSIVFAISFFQLRCLTPASCLSKPYIYPRLWEFAQALVWTFQHRSSNSWHTIKLNLAFPEGSIRIIGIYIFPTQWRHLHCHRSIKKPPQPRIHLSSGRTLYWESQYCVLIVNQNAILEAVINISYFWLVS